MSLHLLGPLDPVVKYLMSVLLKKSDALETFIQKVYQIESNKAHLLVEALRGQIPTDTQDIIMQVCSMPSLGPVPLATKFPNTGSREDRLEKIHREIKTPQFLLTQKPTNQMLLLRKKLPEDQRCSGNQQCLAYMYIDRELDYHLPRMNIVLPELLEHHTGFDKCLLCTRYEATANMMCKSLSGHVGEHEIEPTFFREIIGPGGYRIDVMNCADDPRRQQVNGLIYTPYILKSCVQENGETTYWLDQTNLLHYAATDQKNG